MIYNITEGKKCQASLVIFSTIAKIMRFSIITSIITLIDPSLLATSSKVYLKKANP